MHTLTPCQSNLDELMSELTTVWTPDISSYPGYRYRALAEAIRDAILSEELKPGTKLLAHREMSWRLGVTIGTVAKAYKLLSEWGLVTARIGDGTRVKDPEKKDQRLIFGEKRERTIDFGLLLPSALTDMSLRKKAFKDAANNLGNVLLRDPLSGYAPELGYESHREAGASLITDSGFNASASDIIVTAGVQEAIHLVLSVLTKPSVAVMTEEIGYLGFKTACNVRNRQIAPVAMDEHGIIPESLERVASKSKSKLLFVVPNIQNPTGAIMPLERRKAVAEIAERNDFYILEDNPFWAFTDELPPPIVSLAPDRTFYVTSLSKYVTPALRVGYLRALPKFVPELEVVKHALSMSGSFLQEEFARGWITSGVFYDLVAWQRKEIEARWDMAKEIFGRGCFSDDIPKPFIWLSLPEQWSTAGFIAALLLEGVTCIDSSHFINGRGKTPNAIRIALTTPSKRETLYEGLTLVKQKLDQRPDTNLVLY